MNSAFRNILAGLAAVVVFGSGSALAQYKNEGYLLDSQGNVVRATGANVCVRTGAWTPALAAAAAACKECTPELCPAPKPAAKKPEAKPEAKPKPETKPEAKPKPTSQNVELKIELQGIALGKTDLTDDNKKELDTFLAKEVKPLNTIGAVIITGHTDRLGSAKLNKKLSEDRATKVRDYVVGKGIDQKVIFWEGKADKSPIPVTKFCDNKMNRKQLVECLAPNRRVTVEVVGTRLVQPKPKPETKPEAKPEAKPKP
jgi:OOP family OmpA-OmpF porin